jgi:hypothetical protein
MHSANNAQAIANVLAGKNPVFVNKVRMSSYLTSLQFFIKRYMWGQMVLQVEINACSWQHEGIQIDANPRTTK